MSLFKPTPEQQIREDGPTKEVALPLRKDVEKQVGHMRHDVLLDFLPLLKGPGKKILKATQADREVISKCRELARMDLQSYGRLPYTQKHLLLENVILILREMLNSLRHKRGLFLLSGGGHSDVEGVTVDGQYFDLDTLKSNVLDLRRQHANLETAIDHLTSSTASLLHHHTHCGDHLQSLYQDIRQAIQTNMKADSTVLDELRLSMEQLRKRRHEAQSEYESHQKALKLKERQREKGMEITEEEEEEDEEDEEGDEAERKEMELLTKQSEERKWAMKLAEEKRKGVQMVEKRKEELDARKQDMLQMAKKKYEEEFKKIVVDMKSKGEGERSTIDLLVQQSSALENRLRLATEDDEESDGEDFDLKGEHDLIRFRKRVRMLWRRKGLPPNHVVNFLRSIIHVSRFDSGLI